MGNLNAEFFKTPGALELAEGEEVREASTNGEYYDPATHEPNKCYLVFTNKRILILVDGKSKGGLFKKAQPTAKLIYAASYEHIASLNRDKVGSDDTYCKAIMKDGKEVSFNIFGEVFGPLAMKIINYSGMDIPKNSVLKK